MRNILKMKSFWVVFAAVIPVIFAAFLNLNRTYEARTNALVPAHVVFSESLVASFVLVIFAFLAPLFLLGEKQLSGQKKTVAQTLVKKSFSPSYQKKSKSGTVKKVETKSRKKKKAGREVTPQEVKERLDKLLSGSL